MYASRSTADRRRTRRRASSAHRLVELGTELLVATLPTIGDRKPEPQAGEPTYAEKLAVDEFRARLRRVRQSSSTGSFGRATHDPARGRGRPASGSRCGAPIPSTARHRAVRSWHRHRSAAARLLVLDEVQPEGKRPMDGIDWVRGVRPARPATRVSTTASVTSRTLALEALIRVEEGEHSNVLLPRLLRGSRLADRDRAFTTDLVYGTLRQQRTLDWLLARVLDRPLPQLDPAVRAAVRLGAYQLVAGVSAHAAVSETVDAVGAQLPRARGFVNGTLRALAASRPRVAVARRR